MGIDPTKARSFVNTIVNEYDRLHNPSSGPAAEPVDIFGDSARYETTWPQQIFLEKFSLPEYFKGTDESQNATYQEQISSLTQLFVKTGILVPSFETIQKCLAEREKKKSEDSVASRSAAEKKEGQPDVKEGEKVDAKDDQSALKKKDGDISPEKGIEAKTDGERKEVDAKGEQDAPDEKAEDAAAGKGDVEKKEGEQKEVDVKGEPGASDKKAENPTAAKGSAEKKDDKPDGRTSLERYRQEREKIIVELVQDEKARHKEDGTQAIVQTFLRRKNCELDPKDEIINRIIEKITQIKQRIADRWPQYFNRPQYLKLYPDGKRLFFGHIFQEVYAGSDVEGKERIIGLLKDYSFLLDKSEYVSERGRLFYEGKFSKWTKNPYYKIGISVAIGGALFLLIGHVIIPFAIQFFKSSTFAALSSVVLSRLPIVVVETSSPVLSGIVGVVSFVASTRLYQFLFINNPMIPVFLMARFPTLAPLLGAMIFASNPALIGAAIGVLLLNHSHGLDVRVQDKISASLEGLQDREKAARLLEEGLKAYQIWMYLVQEGVDQDVFKLPLKFFRSSHDTKFLASDSSSHKKFAYSY